MAKSLKIRDLTLRDGQQSSFATRMNQAQIDRCLPFYKDANFYAMEVWGGAVPDSVMRYLNENPWTRLETIHKATKRIEAHGPFARPQPLRLRPLYGRDHRRLRRNSIQSGLGIMRIFDALNDVNNVKSTVKYVKQYGGIADCAVCYTVDPKYPEIGFFGKLMGKKNPKPVFTGRILPLESQANGGAGSRYDHDQGYVGSDPAPPREQTGETLQAESECPHRFPHPLHPGLRSGIGAGGASSQESISSIPTAGTSAAVRERRLSS